jgi:hypothetical protein
LDGNEKNKLEFVLLLSNEDGEMANTLKKSVMIINAKQQAITTGSANHIIFFLWLTIFDKTLAQMKLGFKVYLTIGKMTSNT